MSQININGIINQLEKSGGDIAVIVEDVLQFEANQRKDIEAFLLENFKATSTVTVEQYAEHLSKMSKKELLSAFVELMVLQINSHIKAIKNPLVAQTVKKGVSQLQTLAKNIRYVIDLRFTRFDDTLTRLKLVTLCGRIFATDKDGNYKIPLCKREKDGSVTIFRDKPIISYNEVKKLNIETDTDGIPTRFASNLIELLNIEIANQKMLMDSYRTALMDN